MRVFGTVPTPTRGYVPLGDHRSNAVQVVEGGHPQAGLAEHGQDEVYAFFEMERAKVSRFLSIA